MTGTPSLRAISNGSSPKSCADPPGSTSRTPFERLPYPRERTSKLKRRHLSRSPSNRTKGVFPEPPTDKLPMLTVGPRSRCCFSSPREYNELRRPTPAPKIHASGFITGRETACWLKNQLPGHRASGWKEVIFASSPGCVALPLADCGEFPIPVCRAPHGRFHLRAHRANIVEVLRVRRPGLHR